jgi:hypothetical protein
MDSLDASQLAQRHRAEDAGADQADTNRPAHRLALAQ